MPDAWTSVCARCGGSGIDPVRVGFPDEPAHDPEWCTDCGGSGVGGDDERQEDDGDG
jgi:hypothetical protein